jgi:hypothetical protein
MKTTTRVALWVVVMTLLLGASSAWAQKANYETYVSGGYSNNFVENRGWGYGHISNNVVVTSFSSSSDAWVDPASEKVVNWYAHMRLGGEFIPGNGSVTSTMVAISSFMDGWQSANHYREFETARWEGKGGEYVVFDPILTLNINGFSSLQIPKGELPWGMGDIQLEVTNGLVTNSSTYIGILDETPIGGGKSWWADFDFRGVSVPTKMTVVPEPTSVVLALGTVASAALKRRQRRA